VNNADRGNVEFMSGNTQLLLAPLLKYGFGLRGAGKQLQTLGPLDRQLEQLTGALDGKITFA
jgi:hypothetical protein